MYVCLVVLGVDQWEINRNYNRTNLKNKTHIGCCFETVEASPRGGGGGGEGGRCGGTYYATKKKCLTFDAFLKPSRRVAPRGGNSGDAAELMTLQK